ncbi:Retrovirus-related Pol polyprotein from transposon RE2 [Euphorbia peplus]|nr:Retrovirus-related Pol polyprotein from transposon RE2 [Euphorbia peplus]
MGDEENSKTGGTKKMDVYHLGSNDNPGNVITPVQLRGENYDEWARAIQTSLKAKRKFGFIDGTITKPMNEEQLEDWGAVHSMLVAWLLNTIEPKIRSTLPYYVEASSLWTYLKNRFCVVNGTKICQLKSSLGECKQGKTEDVATYFGRFSKIWDDLITYVKLSVCKCEGCVCDMKSQVAKIQEEDMQHHFLIGLDSSLYGTVRSNLLSLDTLPGIDRVYARVIQEERLIRGETSFSKDDRDQAMAFKVHSDARGGRFQPTDNSNKFCHNCNRDGHDVSSCFELLGYPDWWGDRPRGRGMGRGGGTNGRNGGRGGRGRGGNGQKVRANKAVVGGSGNSGNGTSGNVGGDPEAAGFSGITPGQWTQLLDLLNQAKTTERLQGKKANFEWIIDTGATHHVTGNFSQLKDVQTIATCPIGLPDGKTAEASQEGTVKLPRGLSLSNDRKTRKVIGLGEQRDGLYFFCGVPKERVLNVAKSESVELWHKRLGHPGEDVVKHLPNISVFRTPQQNGRVERKHRHILNVARALRFEGNLPIYFWGECVLAACHLINRTPSMVLKGKSPYEGWKLYDLETKEFFVSRDVQFFENVFPYRTKNPTPECITPTVEEELVESEVEEEISEDLPPRDVSRRDNIVSRRDNTTTEVSWRDNNVSRRDNSSSRRDTSLSRRDEAENASPHSETAEDIIQDESDDLRVPGEEENGTHGSELGRGQRVKVPSTRLRDFVTHTIRKNSPPQVSLDPSSSSGTPYPITHFVNCDKFSVKHRAILAAINSSAIPRNFKEAMQSKGWRDAMGTEIRALGDQKTWILVKLPPRKKALGSNWIFTEKRDENGKLLRYKARLVCFGNHQVEGIDYNETFAHVAKMVTIRTFLSVAAVKGWSVHQMDVHNVFLHGDLDEEVYMRVPPGFAGGNEGKVCRLKKSLYGLRQAPRCWFGKLVKALKTFGFTQSYSDYSLFTLTRGTVQINVLIYVDDLLIASNSDAALNAFKAYLGRCFCMKDMGVLKYFLGLEVARNSEGIFLCQRKYALEIISETGLLGSKPADIPMEQNHTLGRATGALLEDVSQYRRLVGRLIYLSHWEAALRVARYLKKRPGQGILLRSDSNLSLIGWYDSDWASCPITRRSLTGWLVLLGYSPVSWKTKKQHTVSRSSAEAEYRSMEAITCELKWLRQLLKELGVEHPHGMRLLCDSQSALYIAKNPVFHERTKHIEADCHFVRDAIQDGVIAPSYVPTRVQLADIFTKALGKMHFEFLMNKLGICDLHAPT